MSGPLKQSPRTQNDADSLEAVLRAARSALSRGDGWDAEQNHYDRLRSDCEKLGVNGAYFSMTLALRSAIAEIKVEDMHQREDTSYAGSEPNQTLYVCVWDSAHFQRRMYFKFAMNQQKKVEVFTFHEDASEGRR